MDLTKRQKEIFDFIRRYASRYGYPPTVREIGKAVGPAFVLDRPRPPRQPGEGGAAAPRPDQAARDRAAGRPGEARHARVRACRWSVRSPPASRSSPRRTSRSTCRCRPRSAASEGDYILQVKGDSMRDAGILEGDYVVVQRGRRRRQRRDRRRADRGRGDREALLPREGPGPASAGQQGLQADPHPRREGARPGGRRLQERLRMAAARDPEIQPSPSGRRRGLAAPTARSSRAGRRSRTPSSASGRTWSRRGAPSAPSAAARWAAPRAASPAAPSSADRIWRGSAEPRSHYSVPGKGARQARSKRVVGAA